jgi:hypothetical protein
MKKEEAKNMVLRLWNSWPDRDSAPSAVKGMQFYYWLEKEHNQALDFPFSGNDKWQIISGWLKSRNLA